VADWRTRLCNRLDVPASARNLKALDLWSRSEGSPVVGHNPLGARVYLFGQHRFSDADEPQTFASNNVAVDYYVRILRDDRFSTLLIAFGVSRSLVSIWQAIHDSGWRPSDWQSGHYPVLLYRQAVAPLLTGVQPVVPLSKVSHDLFHAWHDLTHELHYHSARQLARGRHWARRMHSAVK
jgi:hypothetical protein